jgi:hypothetical protein
MPPLLPVLRLRAVCLVLLLVGAGLAACQSVKSASDLNANTRVAETIDLLQAGVADIGQRAARRNIDAWQLRLRADDVPALDDIAATLDDLEAELQAKVVDGPATGRVLNRLGEQTRAVARRESAPDRLDRLGAVLLEAGARLQ